MDELSGVSHMFDSNELLECHGKVVRNRLNLPQRIDVIHRYSRTPDIRYLAEVFKCGRRQIKNILRKRKKYLTMWSRNKHRYDETIEGFEDKMTMYSDAVGFVLNEWVERARCYQINITKDIMRTFAKEIICHLKYDDFEVTDEWLKTFKQKYNSINFDLNIKQEKEVNPLKRKPLSISTIIADLRKEYGESAIPMVGDAGDLLTPYHNPYEARSESKSHKRMVSESCDSAMQIEHDDSNTESLVRTSQVNFAKKIENYRDALNQLGPLEQFALFNENIRAVGLINQLENLFRESMAKEGFE